MSTEIPVRTALIQTERARSEPMRIEQMNAHRIIAQVLIMRRIQRQYAATHNHLDLIQMRCAQDVLDDLLEVACVEEWPRLPSEGG